MQERQLQVKEANRLLLTAAFQNFIKYGYS